MHELALFAGAGGGILGSRLLGWRTVCAVEIEPYCREVLLRRQEEGHLEPFPIWDDIRTFDGRPWRGLVDVISGGFPCQDISAAGKGAGLSGAKSGLWSEMARIIGEVRPSSVFVENSPLLRVRGLAVVLKDLALLGYDAQWCRVSAENCGAPHKRDRIWIVADAQCLQLRDKQRGRCREERQGATVAADDGETRDVADADRARLEKNVYGGYEAKQPLPGSIALQPWPTEPDVGRVAHGVAHRVDRLKALGNGQVPRVAATAWKCLGQGGI